MEFLRVFSENDNYAAAILNSYLDTFPPEERREEDGFQELFAEENCEILAIINEGNAVGYLILWKLSDFIFLEHFEIFKQFRGRDLGSNVLQNLKGNFGKIVLESEPENFGKNSARRIDFYKKNGFTVIDQNYIQPSYSGIKNQINLWLLATCESENGNDIQKEIYEKVYRKV